MPDEGEKDEKNTFTTYFRQVPGLGLVAVVPKDWLNKKVRFQFEEKEFETNVMYRGKRSIIRLDYRTANGGPVTVKLLN
jgi:hypothetical protein